MSTTILARDVESEASAFAHILRREPRLEARGLCTYGGMPGPAVGHLDDERSRVGPGGQSQTCRRRPWRRSALSMRLVQTWFRAPGLAKTAGSVGVVVTRDLDAVASLARSITSVLSMPSVTSVRLHRRPIHLRVRLRCVDELGHATASSSSSRASSAWLASVVRDPLEARLERRPSRICGGALAPSDVDARRGEGGRDPPRSSHAVAG